MDKLVISDTNILIDLWTMRLVGEFLMLPFEIYTVDMVLREIEQPDQNDIIRSVIKMGKLGIFQTESNELNDVLALISSNLSITDAAVWFHAKKHSALLLTGDNRLRKLAEADNVRVAGVLYILDKLIDYEIIPASYAAECLEHLKEKNKRLPLVEVDSRLKQWTQIDKDMEGKEM